MKYCAVFALVVALASPASAGVIWDESINGELSTNPAAPTSIAFALGGNTIIGSVANINAKARDFITFTIPAGHKLTGLTLLAYAPDNIAFCAFNAGSTSFVPSAVTDFNFLGGIHLTPADINFNLLTFFVNRSLTSESFSVPELGPGTYCFVIQQTSPIVTSYSLDFIMTGPVPTDAATWSTIKALYR